MDAQVARPLHRLPRSGLSEPQATSREEYVAMMTVAASVRDKLLITGHERAARTKGLCPDCCRHRAARRQTVGAPTPRVSFGRCLVDDCQRWATNDRGFCHVLLSAVRTEG